MLFSLFTDYFNFDADQVQVDGGQIADHRLSLIYIGLHQLDIGLGQRGGHHVQAHVFVQPELQKVVFVLCVDQLEHVVVLEAYFKAEKISHYALYLEDLLLDGLHLTIIYDYLVLKLGLKSYSSKNNKSITALKTIKIRGVDFTFL